MRAALALVLALAACGGKGRACDDLAPVVDRWLALELTTATAQAPAEQRATAEAAAKQLHPALRAALIKSCSDTKWAADTITCVAEAADESSARQCPLTRDQLDALNALLINTVSKMFEAPGSAAP
jgi:hypothetical protein